MDLTKEQIERINEKATNNYYDNCQGVFVEPYGIDLNVKEPVIYMRYLSGGWSGGSCWDDSDPRPFTNEKPKFEVLDLVLAELAPNISYLKYKQIEGLIRTNSQTDVQYYGNSDEYQVEYIIVSELIELLED